MTTVADKILLKYLAFNENVFISDIVNTAQHNQLTLKRITPSKFVQKNRYKIETVSVIFLGKYFNLIDFIHALLKLPYVIALTYIEFTHSAQQHVSLEITMEVYHN